MKTQLIMLDTPIIVSDEKVNIGDNGIGFAIGIKGSGKGYFHFKNDGTAENKLNSICDGSKKIIAGIEGLPSIDWNGLEEEFGWIDVEKLADEFYKNYQSRPYAMEKGAWREGFKKAQSLNEKKFSLEDMFNFSEYCRNIARREGTYGEGFTKNWELCSEQKIVTTQWLFKKWQSLQQPKVFDIEVEVEYGWDSSGDKHSRPKITNNSIKILKKL